MTMSFLALANLHALDFAIIGVLLAIVAGYAIYSQRFTRSVADFLSANRCAGRYLLTVAAMVWRGSPPGVEEHGRVEMGSSGKLGTGTQRR